MKRLICGTTAYATFSGDVKSGRLSHAYMLHFADAKNLRAALKLFALEFFGLDGESADGRRLLNENLPDCRIFPEDGKKPTADMAATLLEDCALRPLERDRKLFIISGFEQSAALVQNKLLKTLEEPPEGVYFLIGVTSLAPVLDTVKSRVKTLTIPPFPESLVLEALERRVKSPLNASAAKACAGILGVAENMVSGGWFSGVADAARKICTTARTGDIGAVAAEYGDIKYKEELLAQIQLEYHNALCERVRGETLGEVARLWSEPVLVYALESVTKAAADIKFNAYFQGLLYDFMLRVLEENDKWSKLRE